jgi:hypothetical protein
MNNKSLTLPCEIENQHGFQSSKSNLQNQNPCDLMLILRQEMGFKNNFNNYLLKETKFIFQPFQPFGLFFHLVINMKPI